VTNSAQNKVSTLVRYGKMPRADTCKCVDCGEPAKHYDHYLGYAPEHALDVEPLCVSCHTKREFKRGRRKSPNPAQVCPHGILGVAKCHHCKLLRDEKSRRRRGIPEAKMSALWKKRLRALERCKDTH
jgi:hypothetical protein